MTVGVLAAMPSELRPFVRESGLRHRGEVWVGRVGDHDVAATTMGVGMSGATRTTQELLAERQVERVVVLGIAGGIDTTLPIGHVVVPELVVDGASGAEYPTASWGPRPRAGRLVTFDGFQDDPDLMQDLRRQGCVAIDMETAAVAAVCAQLGCPLVVFRAISDNATDGSVDPEVAAMLGPNGSPDLSAALRYVLRQPWRLPRLAKLGRDANRASKAAATAAIDALRAT